MPLPDLSIQLTGLELENPTILAAGILGTTGASLRRMAGASAVHVGSAVYDNVNIFSEIASGLSVYLEANDYCLKDITGLAHRKVRV